MTDQILKVEISPLDDDCIEITLRHLPKRRLFSANTEAQTIVYKGHGRDWYCLPSYTPAPPRLLPLLMAISYGPQFKHLRLNLKHKQN